jgi:transposase-like protein
MSPRRIRKYGGPGSWGRRGSSKRGEERDPGSGSGYPVELRLRVVKELVEGGGSRSEVGRVFGIHPDTIRKWQALYEAGGVDALVPKPSGPSAPRRVPGDAQPLARGGDERRSLR